jgi:putative hydrolase of the HAD superfamily
MTDSNYSTQNQQSEIKDPKSVAPGSIRVLLFDLGGVLVEWVGRDQLLELTDGRLSPEKARKFWLYSRWVQLFERGRCRPDEFAAGAVAELGLEIAPSEFLARFVEWDRGPFPNAIPLLEALSAHFQLACLSNNNEIHWPRIRDQFGLGRFFHPQFVSHELDLIKPEPEIFRYVASVLDLPPGQVLFFDDNPECVTAARQEGFQAEVARGVGEVIAICGLRFGI